MKIDRETGEMLSVSAETYEAVKEELEVAKELIFCLMQDNEDLKQELEELKKDPIVAATESKK